MKFLYAILFSIILLYTFLFSLFNLSWLSGKGIALAVLSGVALYKTVKSVYLGFIEEERKINRECSHGVSGAADAFNMLIFDDDLPHNQTFGRTSNDTQYRFDRTTNPAEHR